MTITALPTPPLRSDPTSFAARGDAFLAALPVFTEEANALAVAMNLNSTNATSSSSMAIGTGAKTFTVASGKSFQPGMFLVIADAEEPSTNSMWGQVTSYAGTALAMNIVDARGGGTLASWVISQAAPVAPVSGLRNRIINGNFAINQRAVSGTVTLAAGAYGHDRWKAGASGCTYTFATTANVTTLTITAGSLIQVIEGLNLESGAFALSWSGTASGKIGGGSYSASGITGSITGGTNTSIEFSTGTVSKAQLDLGSVVSTFEQRPYGLELMMCQRYYCASVSRWDGYNGASGTITSTPVTFPVSMRANPTLVQTNSAAISFSTTTSATQLGKIGFADTRVSSATGNAAFVTGWTATAEL